MDIPYSRRAIAKIFWGSQSQAVRLPREFQFGTDEVFVSREEERVILDPVKKRGWPPSYFEALDALGPLDESIAPPPLSDSSHQDDPTDEW